MTPEEALSIVTEVMAADAWRKAWATPDIPEATVLAKDIPPILAACCDTDLR